MTSDGIQHGHQWILFIGGTQQGTNMIQHATIAHHSTAILRLLGNFMGRSIQIIDCHGMLKCGLWYSYCQISRSSYWWRQWICSHIVSQLQHPWSNGEFQSCRDLQHPLPRHVYPEWRPHHWFCDPILWHCGDRNLANSISKTFLWFTPLHPITCQGSHVYSVMVISIISIMRI